MSDTFIEKYAKGRLSISSSLVRELNLKEGNAFVVEIKDNKIIYTKIKNEDLKKLK